MPMSRKLKYYRLIYRGFKMKKNDSLFVILALIGMLMCLLFGYTVGRGDIQIPPIPFEEVK